MTPQEIAIVKRSWRKLEGIDPILIGDVFYSKLFIEAPSLKKMFMSSKESQAKKLIDMLDYIIVRLDKINELSSDIKALANRHEGYGVQPKHYDLVGKSLIWTLKAGLGKDWNEAVEKSWTACYATITQSMLQT